MLIVRERNRYHKMHISNIFLCFRYFELVGGSDGGSDGGFSLT